jgi:tetratricopeptide (TPR) repeat protein
MGAVYLAHDTVLDRPVALKVPRRPGAGEGGTDRFVREARAAGLLHHPNICPVYDAGTQDGIPFLTMAYIPGRTLTEAFPPPRPPGEAVAVIRQLTLALAEAHRQGVIHRDLKPANILVNARGEPIITDFGLALHTRPDETRSTLHGQILGTPAYMPPEAAEGDIEHHGPGGDVYSLGVILYELLTGRLPFTGPLAAVLAQVRDAAPPPPTRWRPDLDPALEAVCLKAMAKRIEDRYASMADFAAALARLQGGPAPAAAPPPVGAADAPASRLPAADPRLVDKVHGWLRDWGWHQGLKKLEAAIRQAASEAERWHLQVVLGWLAGERGHHPEAREQLQRVAAESALAGWARTGRGFLAYRERDFAAARALLAEAAAAADPRDAALRGTIAHLRGSILFQEGAADAALAELHTALEQLGPAHFGTGRVLDTLGMVRAYLGDFTAAQEFYRQALVLKRAAGDEAGEALTHGQLGRLYLEWGRPDLAEEHLRPGITLARQTGDERGEAQLYNHQGQVLLALGRPEEAAPYLDESVRSAAGRFPLIEGYARKDRALAHLAHGETDEADEQCEEAANLFEASGFAEGMAHVRRVWGQVRSAQGRYGEAEGFCQAAAGYFERHQEPAEAARTFLELARVLRARGAGVPLVEAALQRALEAAGQSRRWHLVRAIEQEWGAVSEVGYLRQQLRRLRPGDTSYPLSLAEPRDLGVATVLLLELRPDPPPADSSTSLALGQDLVEGLTGVLARGGVTVHQYRGDGVLALAQGSDHARRAVTVALEAAHSLREFNRPRRVLKWPLWHVFAGVSTGNVFATPRHPEAVTGPAVRLAAALLAAASPDLPCIGETTYQVLGPSLRCRPDSPRTVQVFGIGALRVWDVIGWREEGG